MRTKIRAVLASIAGIAIAGTMALGTAAPAAANTNQDSYDQRMAQLVNQERTSRGIPAIKHDPALRETSLKWSRTMSNSSNFKHDPNLQTTGGSAKCNYIGENIFWSSGNGYYDTPEEAMEGYMNSPGHRANILNRDYKYFGVGTVKANDGRIYNTQRFAIECSTPRPGANTPSKPKAPSIPNAPDRTYLLNNGWNGTHDIAFVYGKAGDTVLFGDWNGDGKDTPAIRRGSLYYISNSTNGGTADKVLRYGRSNDEVLVGDWNGDGKDTLAVRRGKTYYIKNSISGGDADRVINYGKSKDVVLTGDWNGNGKDTFAVRRGSEYHVKNSMNGGKADRVFNYGKANDTVLVGDWNGNGQDTFAVRRGNVYHMRNSLTAGDAHRVQSYGRANDKVYAGDWNGDRVDTLGVRR